VSPLASIPSPDFTAFSVGPLQVHAYALCILAGIAAAIVITQRRWFRRGGGSQEVSEVALWAVPAGIIGGRIYHVITSPQQYFGANGNPVHALYIWKGGLGIWGAIALGAVGALIGWRRVRDSRSAAGLSTPSFATFADAIAPGLLVAQALGRWGNWFNKELFGGPTDLPWGLEVPIALRPDPAIATYHPVFLYESLWCLLAALLVVWAERHFRWSNGQVFAAYVALYSTGRFFFELLRVDEANLILGLRVNTWVSGLLVVVGVAMLYLRGRTDRTFRRPGHESGHQPHAS
jgi:prolipoprotein diacylglyceryl transferase